MNAEDNMNVLLEGVHGCWLGPIGLVSRHGACVARGVGLIGNSKKAMAKQVTVTGKDGKAMNLEQVSLPQLRLHCGLRNLILSCRMSHLFYPFCKIPPFPPTPERSRFSRE